MARKKLVPMTQIVSTLNDGLTGHAMELCMAREEALQAMLQETQDLFLQCSRKHVERGLRIDSTGTSED